MNGLFAAAAEVQRLCEQERWDFCFIGGLAVLRWGEPRLTRDVDVTLMAAYGDEEPRARRLLERFEGRVEDPVEFARRHRVVLLRAAGDTPVDVALGALPFEARTVERSSLWRVPDVDALRTCGPEDLLVHKVFAGRDQDWVDVRGVLTRQADSLDTSLVLDELAPLLDLGEDPGGLRRLQGLPEWPAPPD